MNGYLVEASQPLGLRDAVLNHHGVEVFHVRQADELVDVRIVPLVSLQVWIRELPLLMRLPKERNVEDIRAQHEIRQSRLRLKEVKFDHVESWVMQLFPSSKELKRITSAKPVLDDIRRTDIIALPCRHVRQADVVLILHAHDAHGSAFHVNLGNLSYVSTPTRG